MLTHKLPNWDDISQIKGLGLTNAIGRWMLEPLQNIGQKASNPAIHGTLLIFFVSLAACLVVETLNLKSITAAVIIPSLMVTFPSLTGVLYFMFTAHLYALCIFLFCLSVFCAQRYKYGFAASGVCIILGLAIYQPFVSVAISLFLILIVLEGIRGKNFCVLLKKCVEYACTLCVSTFIYIRIAKLIYPQMETTTYGGAGEMGRITLSEIPRNIARSYKRVLEYFITKPFAYLSQSSRINNIVICMLLLVLFIICVTRHHLYRKKYELVFTIFVTCLLPLGMAFVYFMAPNAPFSALMIYAYVFVYIFAIALAELAFVRLGSKEESGRKDLELIDIVGMVMITLTLTLAGYYNYLLDSQAYFRSEIAIKRVTNYYNRIVSRVEESKGFSYGERVAILGSFYYKDNPSPVEIYLFNDDEGLRELSGVVLENGLITTGVRNDFIRTYIGFDTGIITIEELERLKDTPEFDNMPIYPEEGSIRKINDVWVVKLCE